MHGTRNNESSFNGFTIIRMTLTFRFFRKKQILVKCRKYINISKLDKVVDTIITRQEH